MKSWISSKGFVVAKLTAAMGVIALSASIVTPAAAATTPNEAGSPIIIASQSGVSAKTPLIPPVTEVLVSITNKSNSTTLTQSVAAGSESATFTGLDATADYDVSVSKRNNAGASIAALAEVAYQALGTESKLGTRSIQIDDTTKPIFAPDTTKPIFAQVDDTTQPIYQNQDFGYTASGSNWVPESWGQRWVSATCWVSSGYWQNSGGGCSQVYSHYACTSAGCKTGYAVYKTVCTPVTSSWIDTSYSYSCGSNQPYRISEGYWQSYSYWQSDVRSVLTGYQQKSVVSGYEPKVVGFDQKTASENFDYDVPVMKAVSKTSKLVAPAGQLVIQASGTPTRSSNWATGTVVAKGTGVSNASYAVNANVEFRLGTPFSFTEQVYVKYHCSNARCSVGYPVFRTETTDYIRVSARSFLVR